MCYAIPGKVVELREKIAVIDYFGERRNVLNEFSSVKIGEYVYAQGGILISRIPEEEALEILDFWREKFFELKKADALLARADSNALDGRASGAGSNALDTSVSSNILSILQKVNLNKKLGKEELVQLLKVGKEEEVRLMCSIANNIRQKELGNACCVHGIIEFSNYCRNDCAYCGIRRSRSIERYRMLPDEIISAAECAVKEFGFKALVLQSGEDLWYDDEKLVRIISEIRKLDILIFVSIGSREISTYKKLYEAGARAALIRFETSNKELFERLRPGTIFDKRVELIKQVKNIGYIVATGFLIGLPGETDDDIINNILLTKSLNADMYSFGPLIPAEGTPLENEKMVDEATVLKIIAISRFINKNSKILVTSALETIGKAARKKGLLSGANSLMINVTPVHYRKLYELYPGRPDKAKDIKKNIQETINLLYSLGRAPTDLGM